MERAKIIKKRQSLRAKRKLRVRGKIKGSEARPRVSVFKSNKYVYAQAINDVTGLTIAASDGMKMGLKGNKEGAAQVASDLATKLKSQKVEAVVFDKNGYKYHGVVASFADALRSNGINL